MIELPSWKECDDKKRRGEELSQLELFIINFIFGERVKPYLQAALNEAYEQGKQYQYDRMIGQFRREKEMLLGQIDFANKQLDRATKGEK